ncbi:MAG: hypothetical protein WKG00_22710 [Polyangiaceae bacterium]
MGTPTKDSERMRTASSRCDRVGSAACTLSTAERRVSTNGRRRISSIHRPARTSMAASGTVKFTGGSA